MIDTRSLRKTRLEPATRRANDFLKDGAFHCICDSALDREESVEQIVPYCKANVSRKTLFLKVFRAFFYRMTDVVYRL